MDICIFQTKGAASWDCSSRRQNSSAWNAAEVPVEGFLSLSVLGSHARPLTCPHPCTCPSQHVLFLLWLWTSSERSICVRRKGGQERSCAFSVRVSPTAHVSEQLSDPFFPRDAIEAAFRLYNQVDEEVHRLVLASNRCLQELERLQGVRALQEPQGQVSAPVREAGRGKHSETLLLK